MEATSYLKRYVDFANERPGTNYVVFTMVSSQGASGVEPNQRFAVTSYAEGHLSSDGKGGIAGRMSQYFSDRRVPGAPPRPFDAEEVDDLGVEIGLEDSGRITLVGHSYGGGRQTLTNLHRDDEVVLGSGGSVGNQTKGATFVISLGQLVGPG